MGHKDKGHAGLEPHFLEEQPLPAKEREKERERELVMGKMQISSNTSVHSSVTVSPHTPNHEAHPRYNERSFYSSLNIFKAFSRLFHFQAQNAESWLLLQFDLPFFPR